MAKKSWFLGLEVWLHVGKVLDTPQCKSKNSHLFDKTIIFQRLAIKNMILALAFGVLYAWEALRFGFWMGVVPIYAFLRHSGEMPNFHGENRATCHLTFTMEIRHHLALGDMDCDNHTRRGMQVYIYIHNAQCKHTEQESKCLHP